MKGRIYITLKSDLCAASGDGFSLSIDTDICADSYGFPFIPSRRLKGCLREAAEYIGCDHLDNIFGVTGDTSSGSLRITDAKLKNHDNLKSQAKTIDVNPEKILRLYTSVKASTAIENDSAKENSLRFTRVVNHYSPIDGSELVFVSDIEYSDGDQEHLERICKALRNIGYKRTRGYGSVKCRFVSNQTEENQVLDIPSDENEYELRYTVRLNSPAMFAGSNSMETLDYIPGSAVLGAFAAGYLKNKSADERFEKLFLTDVLKFSNLYISDGNKMSEPAPAVLGKLKGSKEIRYIFREDNDLNIPLPKPFKGGYISGMKEMHVLKETIYHNGKKQNSDSKLLYTQECLSEGQYFSGAVTGTGKDLSELLSVFIEGNIRLGRSKSAQYSSCKIVSAECTPVVNKTVKPGRIYALLVSDVILLDDCAEFSTDASELVKAFNVSDYDKEHSSLRYKTVMGYVSVGRYKRSHIRAFEKGSVICFESDQEMPVNMTIGERQNEGFGKVKLCTKEELLELGGEAAGLSADIQVSDAEQLIKLISDKEKSEELRNQAISYANAKYNSVKNTFTSSFVGRLLLMVNQAESKDDLDKRVASVKDDSKRECAVRFISEAESMYAENWQMFIRIALIVIKYKMKGAEIK